MCPLPAGAGAAAEPGRRVPGLQPLRVLWVPRVPEQDPPLEVHRVLRGQVRMRESWAVAQDRPQVQGGRCLQSELRRRGGHRNSQSIVLPWRVATFIGVLSRARKGWGSNPCRGTY